MINYIKIEIGSASADEAGILIAELSENNYYAFEHDENVLIAYKREEDFNEEKIKVSFAQKRYI